LNILRNVIKFTPKIGLITVESSQLLIENDKLIINLKIQDSGIGTPSNKLDAIFEPFCSDK